MSHSTEIFNCRFLDPTTDNRLLPYVYFDPNNKYELPCEGLTGTIEGFGAGVEPARATAPVPIKGCFEQRRLGLCPRGLSLVVSAELKP